MKRRFWPLIMVFVVGCPDVLPPAPTNISISPIEGPDNVATTVTIRGDFVVARLNVDFSEDKQRTDQMIEVFLSEIELENVRFLEKGAVTADVPPGMEIGVYQLVLRDPNGGMATLDDAFKIRLGTCADWSELNPGTCGSSCTGSPGCGCLMNGLCGTLCGDGLMRDGETCDDGNTSIDDGCNADCLIEPGWECLGLTCEERCGDNIKVGDEECDDGNVDPNDGCAADCTLESDCGNGVIEPFEECDVADESTPGCLRCKVQTGWNCIGEPSRCRPICGDGLVLGQEACDDENLDPFDGCDDMCGIEPGFCCRGAPSECYDTCGNGYIDRNEQCDDRNTVSGDGCGVCCGVEPDWHCLRQPSACVQKSLTSFVDDDGPSCNGTGGTGIGTWDDPFCQISDAIGGPHESIMVLEGTYHAVQIAGGRYSIVAEDGVRIETKDAAALHVTDGANVEAIGLAVTAIGPGYSIEGQGTVLNIRQCEAGPMPGPGVRLQLGAHLRMNACSIRGCRGGGMQLSSAGGYVVTNTIIAENGDGGELGGVMITGRNGESVFANNTVADNLSSLVDPSAVQCLTQGEPIPIVNSILWDPRQGSAPSFSRDCAVRYSTVSGTVGVGLGNVFSPPQLTSDYHIEPTSPCIDGGHPAGVTPNGPAPARDFDGESRPKGVAVDIGADEAY